eukprot:COSAG01_NODE_4179_length_5265_cov_15.857917_5_plen_130_part_00
MTIVVCDLGSRGAIDGAGVCCCWRMRMHVCVCVAATSSADTMGGEGAEGEARAGRGGRARQAGVKQAEPTAPSTSHDSGQFPLKWLVSTSSCWMAVGRPSLMIAHSTCGGDDAARRGAARLVPFWWHAH